jgi:hypothetical protein
MRDAGTFNFGPEPLTWEHILLDWLPHQLSPMYESGLTTITDE